MLRNAGGRGGKYASFSHPRPPTPDSRISKTPRLHLVPAASFAGVERLIGEREEVIAAGARNPGGNPHRHGENDGRVRHRRGRQRARDSFRGAEGGGAVAAVAGAL